MLKLIKGDSVKLLDANSGLVAALKFEGWRVEGEKVEAKEVYSDLDVLRADAEALGLKVHHKAGADKIREMIAEATK